MTVIPLDRMKARVQIAREDSDAAYFHDLMLFGELLLKFTVVGLVAAMREDRSRLRYSAEHQLVRADGIGTWATVLDELLTGPSSQFLSPASYAVRNQLTDRCEPGTWQAECVACIHNVLRRIDRDTGDIAGKPTVRRFFAAFVRIRNKSKAHGAPTSQAISDIVEDLSKALYILYDNLTLFSLEWAHLHRNISGKYRVAPMSGECKSFDILKSSRDISLENGVYIFFDKPMKVSLIFTDSSINDFYIPNGAFTERHFETLSYTTGDTRKEDSQRYLMPTGVLPASETDGLGDLEAVGKSFANLPSPIQDYIERDELERELRRVLMVLDRYPIVTVYGGGGIGKTSLALRIVHELCEVGVYDVVMWFSARDIDLLTQGPKQVKPQVRDIHEVAKYYCDMIHPEDRAKKGFKDVEYFSRELTSSGIGKTLFVFDNFETVSSPIELFNWIDAYIRSPNKVLITTRHREFNGDYAIKVEGMNEKELGLLIDSTADKLSLHKILTHEYVAELKSESGGHPYVAKILLGAVAQAGRLVKIERIVASSDELLTALFERTYVRLSPGAQMCFLALAGWRSNAPVVAVEAVALHMSEERFDAAEAISELERNSFIEIKKAPDSDDAFVVVPFVAAKFGQQKLASSVLKQKILGWTELLQQFGGAQATGVRHGIGPRVYRLMRFVASEASRDPTLLDKYIPMSEFLARRHANAWLTLADIYIEVLGSEGVEKAKAAVEKFIEAAPPALAEDGWRKAVEICRVSEDTVGEVRALVELCRVGDLPFHELSGAANRLNTLFASGGVRLDGAEKRVLFERLAKTMEEREDEATATDLSRMAWLHLNLRDEASAKRLTSRGLDIAPSNSHLLNLAERLKI